MSTSSLILSKKAIAEQLRKFSPLREALWSLRQSYHRARRRLVDRRPVIDAQDILASTIRSCEPSAFGKMGSVEASALLEYLKRMRFQKAGKAAPPYQPYTSNSLFVNAGVFPRTDESFDRFCSIYLSAIEAFDALAAWDVAGEAEIFSTYAKNALLVTLPSLEPFFYQHPWSSALRDKKVLVISPFTGTIEQQYCRRSTLWQNPEILPAFDLLTIRAPLSAGLVPPDSENWADALEKMKFEMDKLTYDVALIGAGAFSLPLAAHAKYKGKVGVHLGGGLQILFGISGARWRERSEFKAIINENWCSPSTDESPSTSVSVENGCYW